jgi:adenosine deaminase
MINFLKELPKAELHLHILGTLEPEMLFAFSQKNKVHIPFSSIEEVKNAYHFHNLQSFLDIYYQGASVLIDEEDFYTLTYAYLSQIAKENVRHVEIFFDPQTHTNRGIPFKTVIEGIHKGLKAGEEKFGISHRLIMCFLRHLSEEDAFKTFKESLPFAEYFVGVGLDSSELGNPPAKFERVFQAALQEGFLTFSHAGEEGPSQYIWEAIKRLKVQRIDHGVRCFEDEDLVQYLVDTQLPLTVCPLSNVDLCVFKDLKEHTLAKMLECGIMATINSDDPAYFGGYLLQNYVATQEALCLSAKQMAQLAENSFRASLLPPDKINEYSQEIRACVQRYQNA